MSAPIMELVRGRYGPVAALLVDKPRADVALDPRVVAECLDAAAHHLDAIGLALVLVPGNVTVRAIRSRRRHWRPKRTKEVR